MVDVSSTSKDNKFRRERVRLLKALVDQVLSEQDHCNIIDAVSYTHLTLPTM